MHKNSIQIIIILVNSLSWVWRQTSLRGVVVVVVVVVAVVVDAIVDAIVDMDR